MEGSATNRPFYSLHDILDPGRHSSQFGDIMRLPAEIWIIIFKLSVFQASKLLKPTDPFHYSVEAQTLINITHTCRIFRRLAVASPSLWVEIDFGCSQVQIETFIERSAQLPLVAISRKSLGRTTALLQFLSKYADRIRGIRFPVDPCDFHLMTSMSALEFIHVGSDCRYHLSVARLDLSNHPKLEALSWGINLTREIHNILPIGGPRLRCLHLLSSSETTVAVLSAIKYCRNLEELFISNTEMIDRMIQNDEPVCLPKLSTLSLKTPGVNILLEKLDIPTVKSLKVDGISSVKPFVLFRPPYTNIWPVSLSVSMTYSVPSLIDWLHKEPGMLRSLRLTYCMSLGEASECITALAHLNDGKPVCPHLEEISMEILWSKKRERHVIQTGIDALTPVYRSRILAGSPPLNVIWDKGRLKLEPR
ncbi:hypothetical protein CPB86DRAFT_636330 [Serendipita vermifera]|nr:hypothetical protein CPB86DRAFT_636330 [Serendipita vermifera]